MADTPQPTEVIEIDGRVVATEAMLHAKLMESPQFPDWYGRNLDALDDILSNLETPITIVWKHWAVTETLLERADVIREIFETHADHQSAETGVVTVVFT